ncbi:hypothetical protein P7K49_012622 [Saguinus oedipus]|uniref:Uncharacterized protein n=1 Tax=Saguinus oedipus TaxID=9490 RepID=A0ABQ9VE14_SAGOE|nr:hypothetical protein P7K49_012622 [Saguinus oedipus]
MRFPRESAHAPAQLPPDLCPGRPSPAIMAHLSPSLRSAQPTPPAPSPTLPGRTRRAPKAGGRNPARTQPQKPGDPEPHTLERSGARELSGSKVAKPPRSRWTSPLKEHERLSL